MNKQTVLIIDDHTLIRETWARLLELESQLDVIGNTGDSEQAIGIARDRRPDIVLLDINMSPTNGFDILKMIRRYSPVSKVIAVSMHSQPAYAKKMIRGGAKGYVTKNSTSNELLEAINEVGAGGTYLCREVKDILAQKEFEDVDGNVPALTSRELEIIEHLKKGLSSKEIASLLFITTKTVEVHRHNILRKLKVKNSAELVHYANNNGL